MQQLKHLVSMMNSGVVTEFTLGVHVATETISGSLSPDVHKALFAWFGTSEDNRSWPSDDPRIQAHLAEHVHILQELGVLD